LVLAYLQSIDKQFAEAKLYPPYSDLFSHYENLIRLKESKINILNSFPKRLTSSTEAPISFEPIFVDNQLMKELEEIIDFSLPEFEKYLEEGRSIYHLVQEQIQINPIGVLQLNNEFGFFMMALPKQSQLPVYKYHLTIYESSGERYRGVNVQYIDTVQKNLSQTYENLKIDITKKHFSNTLPGGYLVEVKQPYPLKETLLPITKRALVQFISI
jgi:hypothetical protein